MFPSSAITAGEFSSSRCMNSMTHGFSCRRAQRGEPHLPIEARLMRRVPSRRAHHIAGFVFERVLAPVNPVIRALDNISGRVVVITANKP